MLPQILGQDRSVTHAATGGFAHARAVRTGVGGMNFF